MSPSRYKQLTRRARSAGAAQDLRGAPGFACHDFSERVRPDAVIEQHDLGHADCLPIGRYGWWRDPARAEFGDGGLT
ncbi:MAG: hypothetical protein AAGC44_11240 [Planctomycetota bacterium]